MKFKNILILYFLTLKDFTFINVFKRIKYELKIYLFKINFLSFIRKYRSNYNKIKWNEKTLLINTKKYNQFEKNFSEVEFIEIEFLNKIEKLSLPINWNITTVSRLWRFNLHYFSGLKKCINYSLEKGLSNVILQQNLYLIDSWINFHLLQHGDGWHSYTLSLRIRNWIWLFRFFPNLITDKIKEVLWIQINWLYENREYHLGGNHLLENLITLILGSLQFKGSLPDLIFSECMSELEDQLQKQILSDGGHEERSCSYHLIILQNLVELGFVIQNIKKIRPVWLLKSISLMSKWAYKVKLNNNNYPRFNDSIYSKEIDIEKIIKLSLSYIDQNIFVSKSDLFYFYLSEDTFNNNKNKYLKLEVPSLENFSFRLPKVLDLEETGWSILRPNKSWEIVFKSGESGPKNLLGHSHSDLYTFDIFYDGKLLIGETGTSQYQFSSIRQYERSADSHNVMQFALSKYLEIEKIKEWHQPLEVWNSFRVARKPKIIDRSIGVELDNTLSVRGLYSPFQKYIKDIERKMQFKVLKDNSLEVIIQDNVFAIYNIFWKFNLHFAPDFNSSNLQIEKLENSNFITKKLVHSWTAFEFGKRIPSKSLLIFGNFEKGHNTNVLKLILSPS
ncbi:MAG: heparinase II/III family protein [Prochlorococcus marinus CUG1431]|uniref:Heparinase II/III family protein n=1 Tax=Prochlorococcus marinus CUG1433 TaxID=2774506 RepID=A0A9D9G3U0_PROMR|nr:heparinase II/III family protein [Prochlorococcus marinus CUG1433]MBO6981262.1 heparinase II/III family protein [Prochlorococcus marinus CUG1431]